MTISSLRFAAILQAQPLEEPALNRIGAAARLPENDVFLKSTPDDWEIYFKCPRWLPGAVTRAEITVPKTTPSEGTPKQPPNIVTVKRGWVEDLEDFAKRVFEKARLLYSNPELAIPPKPRRRYRRPIAFFD